MLITDKNAQKAFSKSANLYEEHADLQKEIGLKLLHQIDHKEGKISILDVGMGTGWLTSEIQNRFPQASVVGLDFAPGMIDYAKRRNILPQILLADAGALPFKKETFDIISSNLMYQWVDDLERAFASVSNTLKTNGVFYFTSFGHKTLRELFLSLEESMDEKIGASSLTRKAKFDKNQIEYFLRRNHFKNITVSSEILSVPFDDLFALMKWIKNVGANGIRQRVSANREWFFRADEIYKSRFRDNGNIYASFEVLWAKAEK